MLLGRFAHVLSGHFSYRESEKKNRTDEDFEILRLEREELTEFGEQGTLQVWCGSGKDFDWENYDSDNDWGLHTYFFGFQNSLAFYTAPTRKIGVRKFVLYIPRNDWSGWVDVVIEEFEFDDDESKDDVEGFENLLVKYIGDKYQLSVVSEESLKRYLEPEQG